MKSKIFNKKSFACTTIAFDGKETELTRSSNAKELFKLSKDVLSISKTAKWVTQDLIHLNWYPLIMPQILSKYNTKCFQCLGNYMWKLYLHRRDQCDLLCLERKVIFIKYGIR